MHASGKQTRPAFSFVQVARRQASKQADKRERPLLSEVPRNLRLSSTAPKPRRRYVSSVVAH